MNSEAKLNLSNKPIIDPLLWKKFISGEDIAFYTIYDMSFDALFSYGLHFTKDKDLVKDCIHDLFLDLHKYRARLTYTNNVLFYLFRSLRRLIYKEQTRKVSLMSNDRLLMENDVPEMAFEEDIIAKEIENENFRILSSVMKELSDKQREGLMLRFEQNFSYKEIAEILGISVESARTSIYRALKDMRKTLKKKGISIVLLLSFFNKNNKI
jgi:RNA polymerase sigma factor (sigma-70 family)